MSTLPHAAESLYDGDYSAQGETATRYWVGVTPRLAIRDGDGGYARIEVADSDFSTPSALLAPFTLNPEDGLRIQAQVRFWGEWPGGYWVDLGVTSELSLFSLFDTWSGEAVTGEWIDIEIVIPYNPTAATEWSAAAAAAAAGDLLLYATAGNAGAWDISFLGLWGGDPPPLRQRQRRDGLGMGAPAIRVGGSRQGSTRIRGHY